VALRRATTVENGKLTKEHEGLYSLLNNQGPVKQKKVLMLGSGLVAGPAVRVIAARKDIDLLIGKNKIVFFCSF
jgi:alpha-aminoadipic semialdehyde synthase